MTTTQSLIYRNLNTALLKTCTAATQKLILNKAINFYITIKKNFLELVDQIEIAFLNQKVQNVKTVENLQGRYLTSFG